MAKEIFRTELRLRKENAERLTTINDIINEYAEQGYKLTLRQLYYQLVSRDVVPNQQKEYAKLSTLLVKGRMAGVVDWDAIEDRIRIPFLPYWVHDIEDAVSDTISSYRLNRQKDQENYIEVWVEKDALSGVLKPITSYYHIHLMVNRGYSSCTAIHDAYKRFNYIEANEQTVNILYLGDHDPSGLDMVRDITDRLNEFGVSPDVNQIALTAKQIAKYNPPPNPAKITDPRAGWYIAEFGQVSWEVDALNPKVLNALLKKNIERLMDMELFHEQIDKEEEDKETLQEMIKETP